MRSEPFRGPPPPWLCRLASAGPALPRWIPGAGGAGDGVVAVPGRCSVSYLLLAPDGGVAVVDAGSTGDLPRILEALAALGRSAADVRFVLPSHLHFDHVLGLDPLARALGVPVALGRVAREHVLSGRRLRFPGPGGFWHTLAGWPLQGLPLPPRADRRAALRFGMPWARDAFTAPLGPELRDGEPLPGFPGWTVLETPGHADDAIALHCADAGLLVCGDTVRNFLGGEWNPLVADRAAFAETRRRLCALPVRTVLPGHGPVLEGRDVIGSLREVPAWLP